MKSIESRVATLEQSLLRMKYVAAAVGLVGVLVGVLIAPGTSNGAATSSETISGRSLRIVDSRGRTAIFLTAEDDSPRITLAHQDGSVRMDLTANKSEANLDVITGGVNTLLRLGANSQYGGSAALSSPKPGNVIELNASESGTELVMRQTAGKGNLVRINNDDSEAALLMKHRGGKEKSISTLW